jgi:hypothetical protein
VTARGGVAVLLALTALLPPSLTSQAPAPPATVGLTESFALSQAYDAVLNADFTEVGVRVSPACATAPAWCSVMQAVSQWWEISLDPDDRRQDAAFNRQVASALAASERWTEAEPRRAEAWFALGASYGVRAQFRVARQERLAAARDGKQIKMALERALTLDPSMHDAKFGLGMYRYYADVAPTALRFLRWLLLLPGGNRRAGLLQMQDAREHGVVIQGEADYQLHLIYLWYEHRSHDALALIRRLEDRYPRNPLFALIEANIHDTYFHDQKTSEAVLRALITRAEAAQVNAPTLALRRARTALASISARSMR